MAITKEINLDLLLAGITTPFVRESLLGILEAILMYVFWSNWTYLCRENILQLHLRDLCARDITFA